MNDITYAVSVDVNNPIIPYNVYVASVLDSNVRYLEITLYQNGNIIALSNTATATASLVTDNVLVNDSVNCTIQDNIITVPLEDLQRHGNLDVQVTVTEGERVLAIPFPIQVRVTPNIAENAQIDENSLGSYAEVVHEIAEARGTYTTLHDAIAAKLDNSVNAVKTMHITDSAVTTAKIANGAVTLQKLAAEVKNIINGKADSATAYTFDATTTEASYRADNYKIIYLNATLRDPNKKAVVITLRDTYARQFGFCEDGSIYTRKLTSPAGSYVPESWANINADILSSIATLQSNKVDTETFTEFRDAVAEEAGDILQDITNLENASIATNNTVADVKAYIGYTDGDILGLQADFENKVFTRLGAAVGLNAGSDFNAFPMYGQRRRVVVESDGTITQAPPERITSGNISYDIMVYQPKFYYKVVPLKLEKQSSGLGYHIRKANYYISSTPHAGFKLHPLFYDGNGNEVEYVLFSAYEASYLYPTEGGFDYFHDGAGSDTGTSLDLEYGVLKSMPNVKPISGQYKAFNKTNAEILAQNKSSNWHLDTIKSVSANQLLIAIEYGTFNTQSAIGLGGNI